MTFAFTIVHLQQYTKVEWFQLALYKNSWWKTQKEEIIKSLNNLPACFTDRQAERKADRWACRQTDRQTDEQMDWQMYQQMTD